MPQISFLHKLWDKGVDISASVIASMIIALIGLAFWRVKLVIDLHAKAEEKRQNDRMEDERNEAIKKKAAIERHETMTGELDAIASIADSVPNAGGQSEVWELVSQTITRRLVKAGVKGASLHTLRHTLASHLLSNGVPLPAVSARLGHSDVNVTARIHSHMLPDDDRRAADAWESVVDKQVQ